MEKPNWQVQSRSYVIQSPHMRLRKDEVVLPGSGTTSDYYVRESNGFIIVFAMTADDHVIVVHQYRYGLDAVTLELPAGSIDDGEHHLACAQRELIEETGFTASRWELLLTAPSDPVRSNAMMHAYIAYDAEQTHEQDLDDGEELEWSLMPIDTFREALLQGKLGAVPSIAAAYAALARLGR